MNMIKDTPPSPLTQDEARNQLHCIIDPYQFEFMTNQTPRTALEMTKETPTGIVSLQNGVRFRAAAQTSTGKTTLIVWKGDSPVRSIEV